MIATRNQDNKKHGGRPTVADGKRLLNRRISKPVGHIALSFLPEDKDKLTDVMMTKIAKEYMELMGIKDTQFLLVRHFDRSNSVRYQRDARTAIPIAIWSITVSTTRVRQSQTRTILGETSR